MARSRNLKPGFFTNALLAELPFEGRLLFEGLWCLADREGRLRDRPKQIKGEIFPHDNLDVEELLGLLATAEEPFIVRYQVDGKRYIQVVNWHEHQSPHHTERESTIPPHSVASPLTNADDDVNAQRAHSQSCKSVVRNQESEGGCKGVAVPEVICGSKRLGDAARRWLDYKRERRETLPPTGLQAFVERLEAVATAEGPQAATAKLERAMGSGWKGWEHADNGKSAHPPPLSDTTEERERVAAEAARQRQEGAARKGAANAEMARLEREFGEELDRMSPDAIRELFEAMGAPVMRAKHLPSKGPVEHAGLRRDLLAFLDIQRTMVPK